MSSRHLQRLAVTPPSEDSDNVHSGSRYTGRLSSSSNQQSPDAPLRAHRACEKCTRTKKKCDKGLPACSRCTRLATNCCYDFVVNPPSLTLVDHGAASHHYKPTGDGPSAFEWLNQVDFTAAQIMQLMAASNVNWRASVDTFFNTVNTWLVIIHPDVWQRRCAEARLDTNTTDPDLALVVLCIHLLTMWNCDEFSSTAMLEHPLYQTAKRIWTLRKAFSKPKIEHIQCGILLSLFELGHGDITRCYQSVGEAASISKVLNLRPGKYVKEEEDLPADPEEEQNRALWWSLVIVDKISHEQSCTLWAPLQMDMPSEDDLLPTEHWLWDNEKGATVKSVKRYPVQIPASIRVGAFQRSCQAAILIGYAANWVLASAEQEEPPNVYSFIQLESAARNLIEALITRSETWGENLNTYALCASLFSLLFYSFTYSANSPNTLSYDPETDMQMKKAIAGINFTIGLVIDGSNGIFNAYRNQEEVLKHCAPVWPYAQYHAMQLLFHYEAVLEDGETRTAHLRQSVETTAKRWGCSRHLLEEYDRVHAARRSGATMCKRCTIGSRTCGHIPLPE
ncbi:fungal specific transcription factor [Colletotrichum plurivorum]|uniref:Fungal specific transcription factor n=1 Tax=Colletotrichum plurivorum TaxID=2175906 RepID=A0A8H6K2G6_9PEZI|nr:fungal specific transcription factor [Colletotrichum plurivorum]